MQPTEAVETHNQQQQNTPHQLYKVSVRRPKKNGIHFKAQNFQWDYLQTRH